MLCNPDQTVNATHTPTIHVSSSGLIAATCDNMVSTKQLTTQSGCTITPGTAAKTAVASQRYTTGVINVAGDTNLIADNIKAGVSIFGVSGTLQSSSATTRFDYWFDADTVCTITQPSTNKLQVVANIDNSDNRALGMAANGYIQYADSQAFINLDIYNEEYFVIGQSAYAPTLIFTDGYSLGVQVTHSTTTYTWTIDLADWVSQRGYYSIKPGNAIRNLFLAIMHFA